MTQPKNSDDDIADMIQIAVGGIESKPRSGGIIAVTSRPVLAGQLRAYGEDEIAARVDALSKQQMQAIFALAGPLALKEKNLAIALCLATVEVIEGKQRPLARKRRRKGT